MSFNVLCSEYPIACSFLNVFPNFGSGQVSVLATNYTFIVEVSGSKSDRVIVYFVYVSWFFSLYQGEWQKNSVRMAD